MTAPPGATVNGAGLPGGVIATGEVIATVGGTPLAETVQSRVSPRRSLCPVVSTAVAVIFHCPSTGSVTSYCQDVDVAPITSGSPRKVL